MEPDWLDESELKTWEGFLAAGTMVNRLVEQQLKQDAGLSHPQYEVLVRLSNAPEGELRMTELAGVALTSKSGLSYQVTQLEKAGLVRRRSCPTDDRGVVAGLTDLGWVKLRAAAPGHLAMVREVFFDGLTKAQLEGLADGIGALVGRLRDEG
ncbi:MarR family winged helix-turn-helix transcriptional regulator [Amycolatopsis sp. H20-H5]|uniref:MarR family winged helix-turn-helix transcriptional regulator n=1 Tax=Amycolatopsis sp. H20-H5 TaxID=3046309 RepID=UPI002DB7CAEB|nr:MarR family transcriptional regulator [Amycolatopsis sp. H20-H5]MEC3982402.1 MarR family transcriptional regulator [Amycolatopsis sp. H20-H5]